MMIEREEGSDYRMERRGRIGCRLPFVNGQSRLLRFLLDVRFVFLFETALARCGTPYIVLFLPAEALT
ncbi:hypothetical protein [Cohnella algarum]|uniref:hypothetical protein n=1 Tax=Cohnella algarum TaxID=2044859 RepID=UPI001967632E|nr:hypothetical protein [Cohnella algarum]MBN2982261.1 hypothetical protein [Cohnella algarum]